MLDEAATLFHALLTSEAEGKWIKSAFLSKGEKFDGQRKDMAKVGVYAKIKGWVPEVTVLFKGDLPNIAKHGIEIGRLLPNEPWSGLVLFLSRIRL
jgi:hypothetical protein